MAARNTTKTAEKLEVTVPMSPYKLANWMTENSEAIGLGEGFEIAPQRLYGYARNGKLEIVMNELGHKVVTPEAANNFVTWFADPERKTRKSKSEEAEVDTDEATS